MKTKALLKLPNNKLDKTVKIQGTIYDRKRVMNHLDIMNAKSMLRAGRKLNYVAAHYEVCTKTIKYNTDPEYRKTVLDKASGKHYGEVADIEERAEYKRSLLKRRARVIVE